MKTEQLDTVEMTRRIRDQMYEETKDLEAGGPSSISRSVAWRQPGGSKSASPKKDRASPFGEAEKVLRAAPLT